MKNQTLYFATTAMVLVLGAAPAFAQTAPTAPQSADEDQATGLEDIVVTAERRSENLQKVPIAITAVTAQALERSGTTGVSALSQVTPGLNLTTAAGNVSPFLRGVGSAAGAVGNSASVAIYIDGVYIPSMAASQFEFSNIERIEVLKGPQGTLFGRNSTGGVISVITKDPSFDPQLRLRAGYGNYQTSEGNIYASTGLSDTVAVDFSGMLRRQEKGWSLNIATGEYVAEQNDLLLRSKLLWTPTADTRVVFAVDYTKSNPAGSALNRPYENTTTIIPIRHVGRFWNTNQDFYVPAVTEQSGISANVEQQFGSLTLRSISAYRKQTGRNVIDLDGTGAGGPRIDITEDSSQFTQELQLLSNNDGPFSWIVGGFYMSGEAKTAPFQNPAFKLFADQDVTSLSGFGQGTYTIVEGTRITAGLRYTDDKYTYNDYRQPNAGGAITVDPERTSSQAKATWRLSLDHQLTDNVLGYVSLNRGFRAGTFNLTDATVPALRPEVLDAIEAGLKSDLLDHRLRINASIYRYDFKDIQIARADANSQVTLNASSAEIYGAEFNVDAAVTDALTLNLGVAYTHGRYGDFKNAPISRPAPTGGNIIVVGDATGNTIIRTPEFSGNAGINYVIPSSVGEFNLAGNYYYNGGWYTDPDNRTKTASYGLVSANIAWTSPSGKYEARLWGKNLTNTEYYAYATEIGPGDVGVQAPPRTFGVTFGVNF